MWPYIITIVSAAGVALITGLIIKDISRKWKAVIATLVIITVVGQVFAIRADQRRQQLAQYSGILEGPALTLLSPRQGIYPTLKLGHSSVFFSWQGAQGQPILRMFEDTELVIWIEDKQLKVSIQIRDSHGELIAEVIGNEWRLREDNLWDRNYDENALEVRNTEGDITLQIILEENYIQFAAKMYSQNGTGFGIGSKTLTQEDIMSIDEDDESIMTIAASDSPKELVVGEVIGVLEVRPSGHPLELLIEPIFRYPSDLHLGERIIE